MDSNITYTMEQLENMDAADREDLAMQHGIKPGNKHYLQLACEIWDAQFEND